MVSKENLQTLIKTQALIKPYLQKEGLRKMEYLNDYVISQNTHEDFERFNNIINTHNIFYGTDSELDNLKELVNLLKAM